MIWNPEVVALSLRARELPRARLRLNPNVAGATPTTIARGEGKSVRVVERSRA